VDGLAGKALPLAILARGPSPTGFFAPGPATEELPGKAFSAARPRRCCPEKPSLAPWEPQKALPGNAAPLGGCHRGAPGERRLFRLPGNRRAARKRRLGLGCNRSAARKCPPSRVKGRSSGDFRHRSPKPLGLGPTRSRSGLAPWEAPTLLRYTPRPRPCPPPFPQALELLGHVRLRPHHRGLGSRATVSPSAARGRALVPSSPLPPALAGPGPALGVRAPLEAAVVEALQGEDLGARVVAHAAHQLLGGPGAPSPRGLRRRALPQAAASSGPGADGRPRAGMSTPRASAASTCIGLRGCRCALGGAFP